MYRGYFWSLPPITVTSKYQPVSTCHATTACIRGKCSTVFAFKTYPFVSTVIPVWNGSTTQKTTVTDPSQLLRISDHHEILTKITATSTRSRRDGHNLIAEQNLNSKLITVYETVTRRAVVPFSDCGPLAIPGWKGSEPCKKCVLEDGSRAQLLDVIECRLGFDATGNHFQKCAEWYETWISRPAPTSKVTTCVLCAKKGSISCAGTYTWTFPQTAFPVTITAPPKTFTVNIGGYPTVSVHPKSIYTIPSRSWNAYVTKSFTGPGAFDFNIYVIRVIIFQVPKFTQPVER